MTLDREDLQAIIEGVARKVIAELETRGTVHADESRYPARMSVAEVAERMGVKPQTVRTNWRGWGLRMTGRGERGRFIFDGATVARRVQQLNAVETGTLGADIMISSKRIREVMSKHHCDYSTACSFLGKRSGEARRGRARAKARQEELLKRQRAQMSAMGID